MTDSAVSPGSLGIFVLGMYRSGTSALTGLLNLIGVELGERMMAPSSANPKGFWEHRQVVEINEALLASLGRSEFDPREMPRDWELHPAVSASIPVIRTLIGEFSGAREWAIKDPRLCRLATVWRGAVEGLNPRLGAVLVVRHPLEVIDSMRALGWISSTARAHLSWMQYLLEAERATRGLPRVLIRYDRLLEDCRGELDRAGQAFGVEWAQRFDANFAAISAFFDQRDRHHRVDGAPGSESLPRSVDELFALCGQRGATDWDAIANVGEQYRRAAELFGPVLDEALVEASITRLESREARAARA